MTIRWGILGCGDVCEVKSGPGFQRATGSALVAVMRRDGAKAADFARRHGVPRSYDNAAALLADPQVDAVYIATPPGDHGALCAQAAAAGKPVYVEKPMARCADECDAMIEACAAAGVALFVAYYRRALPRFTLVSRLLAERRIGTITGVVVEYAEPRRAGLAAAALPWRLQPRHSGGGLILDLGSHALDLVDFWVGPLHGFHGQARRRVSPGEAEDVVAGCGLAGEVPVACRWNFAAHGRADSIAIDGTEGRISVPVFAGDGIVLLETAGGDERFDVAHPPHIQQPLIQSIVDELRGQGRCPSTGRSARRTNQALDDLLRGYYGRRDGASFA
jgi:predicted dehydrogenase